MKVCSKGHEYNPGDGCPLCKKERAKIHQKTWRQKKSEYNRDYKRKQRELDPVGVRQKQNKWRQLNPNKVFAYNLKAHHNLTVQEYEAKAEKQQHSCAICLQSVKLYVDHSHTSELRRGLLCRECNLAIGLMKEDIAWLKSSIDYLEKWKDNDKR